MRNLLPFAALLTIALFLAACEKHTVREELFAQAAAHFRTRLALPPDLVDHLSDEQTVINLALLIQDAKFAA